MPTKTKQTASPTAAKPATPKGGNARELFERGHKLVHGKKPTDAAGTSPLRKPAPVLALPPVEVPDWVTSTLPEHSYQMVIFESDDAGAEQVEMTRAEYIALKAHLAAMRGYTGDSAASTVADLSGKVLDEATNCLFSDDAESTACLILHARAAYQNVPAAVVSTDESFVADLRKLAGWDDDHGGL